MLLWCDTFSIGKCKRNQKVQIIPNFNLKIAAIVIENENNLYFRPNVTHKVLS